MPTNQPPPIQVGDTVRARSGSLQLSTNPTSGTYPPVYVVACTLSGYGTVLAVRDLVIDYDSWSGEYHGLGQVPYRCYLVQCEQGVGWAGEGALVRVEVWVQEKFKS